jgi:hypothetical protein
MFTNTRANHLIGAFAFFALALSIASTPLFAHAASYAYVDATGEVKSISADDWRTAINTAPNIHMHSGVLLLDSAADYGVVGDNVPAF